MTTVHAQSAVKLVGNGTGITTSSTYVGTNSGGSYREVAQQLTTGTNTADYILTTATIWMSGNGSADTSNFSAAIYDNSSGRPGTLVYTLTNPSGNFGIDTGRKDFAAPTDATLTAEIGYWLVLANGNASNGEHVNVFTTDVAEDADSPTGWSIANQRNQRTSTTGSWVSSSAELRIRLTGYAVPSTDATLSALDLTWDDSGTETDIELDPAFDTATMSYTASVAGAMSEILVDPTTNYDGATVEFLDVDDMAIDDANTMEDGHQAALAVGANTIKVKVTAEDTMATETYTVVVTRAAPPPLAHCETGDIRCATLTVSELEVGSITIGFGYNTNVGGSLSHDEFRYDGTDYTVSILFVTNLANPTLRIEFDPTGETVFDTDDLLLHVDGTAFAFGDTTFVADQFQWTESGLSWADGDTVEVRLAKAPEHRGSIQGRPQIVFAANPGASEPAARCLGPPYEFRHYANRPGGIAATWSLEVVEPAGGFRQGSFTADDFEISNGQVKTKAGSTIRARKPARAFVHSR